MGYHDDTTTIFTTKSRRHEDIWRKRRGTYHAEEWPSRGLRELRGYEGKHEVRVITRSAYVQTTILCKMTTMRFATKSRMCFGKIVQQSLGGPGGGGQLGCLSMRHLITCSVLAHVKAGDQAKVESRVQGRADATRHYAIRIRCGPFRAGSSNRFYRPECQGNVWPGRDLVTWPGKAPDRPGSAASLRRMVIPQ